MSDDYKLCLFGCNKRVLTRGVCSVCHVMILRLIHQGRISWEELEELRLAAPVDPKVAAHRSRIALGWTRPNRILITVEAVRRQMKEVKVVRTGKCASCPYRVLLSKTGKCVRHSVYVGTQRQDCEGSGRVPVDGTIQERGQHPKRKSQT